MLACTLPPHVYMSMLTFNSALKLVLFAASASNPYESVVAWKIGLGASPFEARMFMRVASPEDHELSEPEMLPFPLLKLHVSLTLLLVLLLLVLPFSPSTLSFRSFGILRLTPSLTCTTCSRSLAQQPIAKSLTSASASSPSDTHNPASHT